MRDTKLADSHICAVPTVHTHVPHTIYFNLEARSSLLEDFVAATAAMKTCLPTGGDSIIFSFCSRCGYGEGSVTKPLLY
jgi:hypothetical protein